jgi:hypothetical protein
MQLAFPAATFIPVEGKGEATRFLCAFFPDQGFLVTIRKLGAIDTVTPDLVGQL